jgi:hypothetical protein
VKLLNAAIVALALLATLGGYLQEKQRLERIIQLPPADARALYEKAQVRRERVLVAITGVLMAAAAAALILFKVRR